MSRIWIMAQGKGTLIHVEHLHVTPGNPSEIVTERANGLLYCLGIYDTENRALEILGEIQQFIANQIKTSLGGLNVHEIEYIFQMPKT